MLSGHERGLFFNVVVGVAIVDYDNETGWAVINGSTPPVFIEKEKVEYLKTVLNRAGILDKSDPYVVRPTAPANTGKSRFQIEIGACPKCGGLNLREIDTGECMSCKSKPLSPRQQAVKDGKLWYTPSKPCPVCGTYAERRVNNGACKECARRALGPKDGRSTPESELMRETPDAIITKEQAEFLGLKVYRTGKPCKRGHTGWRYVSTNSCIDCLRSKK